jgi:hypothetical protein
MTNTMTLTLSQRMNDGQVPVADALRWAMQVGESLRRTHDAGQVHGAVTPDHIYLAASGAELEPAFGAAGGMITPYTAPEALDGRAEARSDIYSFGMVLFEMLTGRRPLEGDTTGSPAADRLIIPCLAKNPDARASRMQKVLMELKLLSVAVHRAASAARREPAVNPAVRAEMLQLEARMAERLAAHERTVVEIHRSATEAVMTLKGQLSALGAEMAEAQERFGARPQAEEIAERILARVDRGFEAVSDHIQRVETTVEEMRQHGSQLERDVAADFAAIEENLRSQTGAIESARAAMAQTDDLVERVVEALESLQTAVLDQADGSGDRTGLGVN